MQLKTWRKLNDLTVEAVARRLGLARSTRTLLRIENGETLADADMVDLIVSVTDGDVGVADMHRTRLDWLRSNRPDKFPLHAPEAAE